MGDAGGREAVEEAILVAGAQRFDPSGTLGMRREDLRHVDGRGRHRGREGGFTQGHRVSPVRGRDRSRAGRSLSPGQAPNPPCPSLSLGPHAATCSTLAAKARQSGSTSRPSRRSARWRSRCARSGSAQVAARPGLRAQLARLGHHAPRFCGAHHRVTPRDGAVAGGPGQHKALVAVEDC